MPQAAMFRLINEHSLILFSIAASCYLLLCVLFSCSSNPILKSKCNMEAFELLHIGNDHLTSQHFIFSFSFYLVSFCGFSPAGSLPSQLGKRKKAISLLQLSLFEKVHLSSDNISRRCMSDKMVNRCISDLLNR